VIGQGGDLARGAAHRHAFAPVRAQRMDGLEGGDVAEIVTGEQDRRGIAFRGQGGDRRSLVHAAGP